MDGSPSSWSAAIDQKTSVAVDDIHKLFLVSAGNIEKPEERVNYSNINLVKQIEDPTQSWNKVTVGAYTNLDKTNPEYQLVAKKVSYPLFLEHPSYSSKSGR